MYVSNAKNNILQVPFLKPGEVKIVIVRSISQLPGSEILQIKGYVGEEIDKAVIRWFLALFIILSAIYGIIKYTEN